METSDDRTADPAWPPASCPAWCVAEHQEEDHPDDRYHRSRGVTVPVALREVVLLDGVRRPQLLASELSVLVSRHVTESEPSLYVGETDRRRQYLCLTPESARRLLAALGGQILELGQTE